MTAQSQFKVEGTMNIIGQDWHKLLEIFENSEKEHKPFEESSYKRPIKHDESSVRALHDVKRLKYKDMGMYGRCPETELFYTVVCSICSMILIPQALKKHIEKRHGDVDKSMTNITNVKLLESPKVKKKTTPIKTEIKTEKPKKIKSSSSSPPDLTDEITKEKRAEKIKKLKGLSPERTVPPELEPMTVLPVPNRSEKRKQKLVVNPAHDGLEMQPVMSLIPPVIKIEPPDENIRVEVCSEKKSKSKDKKKSERKEKADKVYDPNKNCGVLNDLGKPCLRSILCKVHQVALKRSVQNRAMPYDSLIKLLKSQNDSEEKKMENGLLKPKVEDAVVLQECHLSVPIIPENIPVQIAPQAWVSIAPENIKLEEPAPKRMKTEHEEQPEEYMLPPDINALIEQTLIDVQNLDVTPPPPPTLMVAPKPEPILRWGHPVNPPSPLKASTPPHINQDDIHWHTNHPKPLAANTFGCRLIGGLMSTCKKLDTLRKHLQNVWPSPENNLKSSFNDLYATSNTQTISSFAGATILHKKMNPLNKSVSIMRRSTAPLEKTTSTKRKRKTNTILSPALQNSANASDIISGLLIGNGVPLPTQQRASSVSQIQSGVIPVNNNNVRLYQGPLPVLTTSPNQTPTIIQLNLCPQK